MEEILKELPKLGVPSLLLSIILIILRMKPITLFTSNPIEIKMLSKEKRFSIKLFKFILEIIITIIFMLFITDNFFTERSQFNYIFAIVWAILLLAFFCAIMFFLEIKNKNFFEIVKNLKTLYKIILFLTALAFSLGFYLLPTYIIGTQIYSVINSEEKQPMTAVFFILGLVSIFYAVMVIAIIIPVMRVIYRFFDISKITPNYNTKHVYIELEGERWYLYHPINEKLFYLANEPYFSGSTRYRFIEREELYKHILMIQTQENL